MTSSDTLTTRSGFPFVVRRAHPGDEPALAAFFRQVTPEDLRFRFLTTVREVSHERLVAMTTADDRRTESFLAFAEDGATIVAAAMLASDDAGKRGEVAIAIRGDHKGRGIGWSLLEYLVEHARRRGLSSIESIEDRQNRAAIALEEEMGFTVEPVEDDPTLVVVRRALG